MSTPRTSTPSDAGVFKACVTLIHDELGATGSYDLDDAGLCYAISHAGGTVAAMSATVMTRLFTELEDQAWIEPPGVWGPHRLGLICFLNAMSVDEIYEIANSPLGAA